MTELREDIVKILVELVRSNKNGNYESPYPAADSILSLPSGVEAVKKCEHCDGCGNVMIEHGEIRHPNTCFKCGGSGSISRDVSIGELNEHVVKCYDNKADPWTLPTGETLRVKRGEER